MQATAAFHGTFSIERTLRAPLARVFAAWTDIELKARWFIGPAPWQAVERQLDFRVGGTELMRGEYPDGPSTLFVARYHVIVPNRRLVYVYDVHTGAKHLSVSLATVEFVASGESATRITFTEQAAFLDGEDGLRSRELGSAAHLDRLARWLAAEPD